MTGILNCRHNYKQNNRVEGKKGRFVVKMAAIALDTPFPNDTALEADPLQLVATHPASKASFISFLLLAGW